MVTNCSGERSFSRFKRIKNELDSRNVAGEVVQSDKLRQTNCNKFLDNFVMKKARKKLLTVYCRVFLRKMLGTRYGSVGTRFL